MLVVYLTFFTRKPPVQKQEMLEAAYVWTRWKGWLTKTFLGFLLLRSCQLLWFLYHSVEIRWKAKVKQMVFLALVLRQLQDEELIRRECLKRVRCCSPRCTISGNQSCNCGWCKIGKLTMNMARTIGTQMRKAATKLNWTKNRKSITSVARCHSSIFVTTLSCITIHRHFQCKSHLWTTAGKQDHVLLIPGSWIRAPKTRTSWVRGQFSRKSSSWSCSCEETMFCQFSGVMFSESILYPVGSTYLPESEVTDFQVLYFCQQKRISSDFGLMSFVQSMHKLLQTCFAPLSKVDESIKEPRNQPRYFSEIECSCGRLADLDVMVLAHRILLSGWDCLWETYFKRCRMWHFCVFSTAEICFPYKNTVVPERRKTG